MTKRLIKDLISSVKSNRISKDFWRIAPEELELAKSTLECAKRDFDASNLLWAHGDKPNAIYHLQQGVEKLAKAQGKHGLYQNSRDFFRTVGHESPTVYLTTLTKKVPRQLLLEFKKYEPRLDITPIDELQNLIKNLKKKDGVARMEIASLGSYDISRLLGVADIVMALDNKKIVYKALEEDLGKNWKNIIKTWTEELIEEERGSKVKLSEKDVIEVIERDNTAIAAMFQLGMPLYILALVTFPHEAFTRYPDTKKLGPKDYVNPLGIVVMYERLLKLGYNLFEKLQIMIKYLDS